MSMQDAASSVGSNTSHKNLSSPSPYPYIEIGMVMMPKRGVPTEGATGGSMGSTSATKSVAVAVPLSL
jgi:hypothetical protein